MYTYYTQWWLSFIIFSKKHAVLGVVWLWIVNGYREKMFMHNTQKNILPYLMIRHFVGLWCAFYTNNCHFVGTIWLCSNVFKPMCLKASMHGCCPYTLAHNDPQSFLKVPWCISHSCIFFQWRRANGIWSR